MALFRIGFKHAKKILMIPEKIYLDRAEQLGLVTKRCPIDSLEKMTLDFCQNLADKPQGILIPIKILLNNFHISNLESYFERESEALELTITGDLDKFDDFVKRLWKA